jgi:hypothetical protein
MTFTSHNKGPNGSGFDFSFKAWGIPALYGPALLVAALAILAYGAYAGNFLSLDYRRTEQQPLDRGEYSAIWRYGNSESIGQASLQSFWEMNSSTGYGAALSRFEFNLSGARGFGGRWSINLGDQDFFTGSAAGGTVGFRGFRVTNDWALRHRTEVLAGQAYDLNPKSNRPTFGANRLSAALTHRWQLRERTALMTFLFHRRDTAASQPWVRLNIATSLAGLSLEEGTAYGLATRNHIIYSHSQKNDSVSRRGASGGTEWMFRSGPTNLAMAFQFVSPEFSGARNDGAQGGYQHFSASGSRILLTAFTLIGAYSRHWSQAPKDSMGYWSNFWRGSYGLKFQHRRWPGASYRIERYAGSTSSGDRTLVRARQTIHSVSLDHRIRAFNWQLGYRLQDRFDLENNSRSRQQRYTAAGQCRWGPMSLFLNEDVERNQSPRLANWTQYAGLELRWPWRLSTSLGISAVQSEDEWRSWHLKNWRWEAAEAAELGGGWRAAASIRRTDYAWYPGSSYLEWGLRLERSFDDWNNFMGYGSQSGTIFEDGNGNGRHDTGESGIPGIPVLVDGQRRAVTDAAGRYSISGIPAGRHRVKLDLKYIRASLNPGQGLEKKFWSTGLPGSRADFPMVPLTAVSGRVFWDTDRNGRMDSTEQGLPGIYVLMNGARKFVQSDQDGRFLFHNLEPGTIRFFIDPKYLPDTLEVIGPHEFFLTIEDRKGAPPLQFAVARKMRPIRKIIFSPAALIEEPAQAQPIPGRRGRKTAEPRISAEEKKRLYDQGIKQYSAGDYRGAMATWQRLLQSDPQNQAVRHNLQRTKAKLEALRKAKQ